MRLDEYISEAVSHGLHKSAWQDLPEGDSEDQIKEWLDDLGIPRGESVNNMRLNWYVVENIQGGLTDIRVCIPHGISSSYVFTFTYKQGKLKKVASGSTSHAGGFQWRPKEYHIPCGDILTALEIYRTGKDTVKESVTHGGNVNRKALDKMDDIFSEPYGMTLENYIQEAVSHGGRHPYPPEFGCTVKDIVRWLDSYGIKRYEFPTGTFPKPEPNSIIYVVGPCDTPGHSWVSVANNVKDKGKKVMQRFVIRTEDENTFYTVNGEEYPLDFDGAIRAVEAMISHPDRPVKMWSNGERTVVQEAVSHGRPRKLGKITKDCSIPDTMEILKGYGYKLNYSDEADEISKSIEADKPLPDPLSNDIISTYTRYTTSYSIKVTTLVIFLRKNKYAYIRFNSLSSGMIDCEIVDANGSNKHYRHFININDLTELNELL